MTIVAMLELLLPGAALVWLLFAIATQRPDPSRAVIVPRRQPRSATRDPERRPRHRRGIEI